MAKVEVGSEITISFYNEQGDVIRQEERLVLKGENVDTICDHCEQTKTRKLALTITLPQEHLAITQFEVDEHGNMFAGDYTGSDAEKIIEEMKTS